VRTPIEASEGRQVAAFRILDLASKRMAVRKKAKPRERQNKNRSKLRKHQIASSPNIQKAPCCGWRSGQRSRRCRAGEI
jgi:hypothetical protein